MEKAKQFYCEIREKISAQKETIFFCFVSVFAFGLIAHAYGFLHNNLSHDVLNAFVATQTEENWKIELGRFFVPIYRAIFRGPLSLPWLIGILGLLWQAIAVFFFVRIFNIRSKFLILLTAGIFTTNITNIGQIATYVYEFDFNALSLAFAVLAVYLWDKNRGFFFCLLGSMCLLGAIGIYQAYFAVTVTLIVWKSIMDLFDDAEIKDVFTHGLKGIGMILLGGLLYLLLGMLIYGITGIEAQSRTNVLDIGENNPFILYFTLIKPSLHYLVRTIFHPAYNTPILPLMICILSGMLVASAILLFIKKRYTIRKIAFIIALVSILPFAMTCIFFLARGRGVHDLMSFAIWFFYIFMAMFTFKIHENRIMSKSLSLSLKMAVCALLIVIIGQNITLANTAYIKKEAEANATLSTMTRVVSRLEESEDYIVGETPIAFIGTTQNTSTLPGMEHVSSIVGLYATSSIPLDGAIYYYNAYGAYFKYVLQYPINLCSDETHAQLKQDERVQALPIFPQNGCIELIDGILVVKIG